ncbi:MAG: hypothetical protein MUC60_03965 [Oscillatoria sp. Prado101]|jgi:hypothetical protein|nr:hypothetical protein [Oscillatoria sp. Prado101]
MDVQELKFLLKLLGFPECRAPVSEIKPNPKMKPAERDSICRSLRERDLVAYSSEVIKFTIAPPGKSLLKLDTTGLPITDKELKVLHACASATITPAEAGIPAANRQEIVQGLADRGLIKAEKTQIKDVWLTERGKQYLLDEYVPKGSAVEISLDMLANYLRFLRKSLRTVAPPATPLQEGAPAIDGHTLRERPAGTALKKAEDSPRSSGGTEAEPAPAPERQLTDADILQAIRDLDRQLDTDNYLPIFHLRQKLEPPLSREELNRALYRLQRSDKIELSSLQEAIAYTPEQLDAGIPQDVGGPLFFIIVI